MSEPNVSFDTNSYELEKLSQKRRKLYSSAVADDTLGSIQQQTEFNAVQSSKSKDCLNDSLDISNISHLVALDMGTQNGTKGPVEGNGHNRKYASQRIPSGTTKNKKAPLVGQRTIDSYFCKINTCQINLIDTTPINPVGLNLDKSDTCPSVDTQGNVGGTQPITNAGSPRCPPHKVREPLLFNDSTNMHVAWTLDENKKPILQKLEELIRELKTHDQKIFEASLVRIKSQMSNPDFVKRTSERIISDTCDILLQEEETQMPSGARSSWNHARNAAVEAAKATNRVAFYKEAPLQGLHEYWCFGLERTPGYLMKIPDRAEAIIKNASIAYDITVANMSGNEFKELDRRRQTVQASPPTVGDIIDPVSNVTRTTAKTTEDKGFRGRGRGRGGPRPWKPNKDRKPYNRSNQKK